MNKKILVPFLIVLCFFVIGLTFYFKYHPIESQPFKDTIAHYMALRSTCLNATTRDPKKIFNNLMPEHLDAEESIALGITSNVKSMYYALSDDYPRASHYLKEAITYYSASSYGKPLLIRAYTQGLLYTSKLNMEKDKIAYAYPLLDLINDPKTYWIDEQEKIKTQLYVYANLVELFTNHKIFEKAAHYYDLMDKLILSYPDYLTTDPYIAFTMLVYNDAIGNYKKANELATTIYLQCQKNDASWGTQTALPALGDLAYTQLQLGEFDPSTLEAFNQCLAFFRENKNLPGEANTLFNIGLYYQKVGDYARAFDYIIESLAISETLGDFEALATGIDFILDNKTDFSPYMDPDFYYAIHYKLDKLLDSQDVGKDIISLVIDINDRINTEKLLSNELKQLALMKKNKLVIIGLGIFSLTSVVLTILIYFLVQQMRLTQKAQATLKALVNQDYLTQCTSKSAGLEKINALIHSKKVFSLGIIDIDNFKQLNDQYGHLFGDHVLSVLGRELSRHLSPEDLVIRFGGEEFIIVYQLPLEAAYEKLEAQRLAIHQLTFKEAIHISISGGIITHTNESMDELIEAADQLLYLSKGSGKNKISTPFS